MASVLRDSRTPWWRRPRRRPDVLPGVARLARLELEPSGHRIDWPVGETMLDAMGRAGVTMPAGCRQGRCGSDLVTVQSGTELLDEPGELERAALARLGCPPDRRTACTARCTKPGDVRVSGRGIDTSTVAGAARVDASVRRVVIVGTGVAGVTVAEEVRRRHPGCSIDLVGAEAWPGYDRTALAELIGGSATPQELALRPPGWAAAQRVTTRPNTLVQRIDRERRAVELVSGERLGYDRLVLATGAVPRRPAVANADAQGCFVLHDADDAVALRSHLQRVQARHAVVVGGGVLGVESAAALHRLGLSVVVLEHGERLLGRELDDEASDLLNRQLGDRGITVDLGFDTVGVEVDRAGHVQGVTAHDGRTWMCQLVVFCTGAEASAGLAEYAGLKVDDGIVVDERMRTRDPAVLAVGDCARCRGTGRPGLGSVALEQARVAAVQVVGGDARFRGHVPVVDLKVDGVRATSAGRVAGRSLTEHVVRDTLRGTYAKLLSDGGFLVGAMLVGPVDARHRIVQEVRDYGSAAKALALLDPTRPVLDPTRPTVAA